MASTGRFLRRFDLGNKAIEGIFDSSLLGAIVTMVSVTLMTVLFLSELLLFIKVDTSSHMAVADFHEHDAVSIRLHVTFPYIECTDLAVIADNPPEPTAIDRRPASRADARQFKGREGAGGGCTLDGTLEVARAGGSVRVHVIHHDPRRLIVMSGFVGMTKGEKRTGPQGVAGANVTHKIHDFGFWPTTGSGASGLGRGNPLAGTVFVSEEGAGQVRYSLKVVPITHQRLYGHEVKTHTYSSNVAFVNEDEAMRATVLSKQWLGVDFEYDFSPVMVRYTETRKSMFEFLTSVYAIVGGIYTVSGLFVQGVQGVSKKKHD